MIYSYRLKSLIFFSVFHLFFSLETSFYLFDILLRFINELISNALHFLNIFYIR